MSDEEKSAEFAPVTEVLPVETKEEILESESSEEDFSLDKLLQRDSPIKQASKSASPKVQSPVKEVLLTKSDKMDNVEVVVEDQGSLDFGCTGKNLLGRRMQAQRNAQIYDQMRIALSKQESDEKDTVSISLKTEKEE